MTCESGAPAYNNSCSSASCFYIYGAIVPFVTLLGLVGNGLSIYVLLQRRMRSFIHLLLAGLCGYDCFLLVTSLVVYVQLAYCECLESICALLVASLPFFYPLAQVGHAGSIYCRKSKISN